MYGLSEVDHNTWVWCGGFLEGIESFRVAAEGAKTIVHSPAPAGECNRYTFCLACKQLAEIPKIRQIHKYLFIIPLDYSRDLPTFSSKCHHGDCSLS